MKTIDAYSGYKAYLFRIAYQMLGSVTDAEDIVHDIFVQYLQTDQSTIRNEQAYLTKMTVNRCLNLLSSSRRKREVYIGSWLPEPLADTDYYKNIDPVERRENIGYAFLMLMQKLTPLERAIYILREVLQHDYAMIADIMRKTEMSCRKTFSRAKYKTSINQGSALSSKGEFSETMERFSDLFIRAADTGDFSPLHDFLLEDARMISDGGGKTKAAIYPIYGLRRVRAFFEGLSAKGRFAEGFSRVDLNGQPGLLLRREGRIVMAIALQPGPSGPGIEYLYLVLNPDKLARFNRCNRDTSSL